MEQYCLYLRKSRADAELEAKGEMETLARHEHALLDLAKRQKLNITKIYREVVSGETIASRPVVQEMLAEVENGTWTGVLVMEIERLARGNTIDQGVIAQSFKMHNTKIITPIKTYDPSNEFDEEYFEFGLFMSRREYKTINRRIQRGRIASVKDGKYIGSVPPYGYDKVKIPNDKGYTLALNDESQYVKLIYDLYLHGDSQPDGTTRSVGTYVIADILNDMHVKTRSGKPWTQSTVKDILKNPVYTGKIRWSYKKETKSYENGIVKKTRRHSDKYLLIVGLHEAIIDENDFNAVQKLISTRAKTPTRTTFALQNPLAGLLYCKECGTLMTRVAPNHHQSYDTLRCPNKNCKVVASPLLVVEKEVIRILQEWIDDYLTSLKANHAVKEDSTTAALENSISTLDKDISTTQKQLDNTFDLLEQGIYTKEVFVSRNRTLTKKLAELKNSREELFAKLDSIRQSSSDLSMLAIIQDAIDNYFNFETATERNDLLKSIIGRIEYTKTERNTRGKSDNINFTLTVYPSL